MKNQASQNTNNKKAAIKVNFHAHHDIIAGNDEYNDTSTSYTITSVEFVSNYSFNCVGNFDPKEADKVYIVYAVYSTGDSFSNHQGSGIEFLQAFTNVMKAKECMDQVQANAQLYKQVNALYRQDKKAIEELKSKVLGLTPESNGDIPAEQLMTVSFHDNQGKIQRIGTPWNGHFESLDYVEVEVFTMKMDKSLRHKM